MTAYIIRRLLYMIPIVIGVLLVTFCLFTVVGGDISQQIAGKNADAETIAEIRHEYGFDKPLFVGHTPLEGDDSNWAAEKEAFTLELKERERKKLQQKAKEDWESEKEAFILRLKEQERGELQQKAEKDLESEKEAFALKLKAFIMKLEKVEPIKEPEIKEDDAKKEWLSGLFWQRVRGGHLIQSFSMLDFNSQFLAHFKKAVTFNFGRAMDRQKIGEKILQGVGPSLSLTIPMFIGSLITAISLSLIVAFIRGSVGDFVIVILCVILMSVPYLSYIIFGQFFFAYKLGWFPIFYDPSRPMAISVILPILIGIVAGLGFSVRFYRTIMLDEVRSDYVRTAFAKGLATRTVLFKHVLKNAMIPIVTNVVLSLPRLVLGSLLLERFFGIPGLGYLMIESIGSRDFFVLNAMTFIMALLIAFFTLVADVCYAWVDPRVKFE